MNNLSQRVAVGGEARIGTFYNASNDAFLANGIFEEQTPPDAVHVTSKSKTKTEIDRDDRYQGRFAKLKIGPSLAATILARLIDCKGSTYLLTERRSQNNNWLALYHTVLSVNEKLNPSSPAIQDLLSAKDLYGVTHIVAGVQWGVRSIITAQYASNAPTEGRQIESQMAELKAALENVEFETAAFEPTALPSQNRRELETHLDIMAYSDVLPDSGIILKDLQEAYEFLAIVPIHIKNDNGGKGRPISYSLLPIDTIAFFLQLQITTPMTFSPPTEDCLNAFIKLFDDFQSSRSIITNYISYMATMRQYLPSDRIKIVERRMQALDTAEAGLMRKFPAALRSVRQGGDQSQLLTLLHEYTKGDSSPSKFADIDTSDIETVNMLHDLVSKGAAYIDNNLDLEKEQSKYLQGDVYVMYFDRSFVLNGQDDIWSSNYNRFVELLETKSETGPALFVVYDCSSNPHASEEPHISFLHNGQEVAEDLLEHEHFMSAKCFAKCSPDAFETKDVKKPIKRRFVTIPCPASECDHKLNCDWTCLNCFETIEYGFTDDFFYCNCGRSKFTNFEFQCNGSTHASGFGRHDPAVMLKLLRNLGSSNYLNVLILGETGVGKSTFINALVNYLQFETLEEAMASEELQWVIPCSFSTQTMDRSNPDEEIKEQMVRVGSRDDEQDGSKGDSATQQTTVYPVTVNRNGMTHTVRLIDTPGIGDTRGVDFDKKNMADILTTISSYDELHGILILLKSNAARLTITFQYCVKELFVHLHQSAARNMVFGFTNTRITNYTPGDTFQPLKRLLNQNRDVGLALSINTTYCFDSESFRYLAASKNGVVMPNKEDFDRSWKHSRDETQRLMDHFRSIPAHETKSTMSLNGARQNISELTKPMAEISELIRKNIALCEDQRTELKDKCLTGDQLRANLNVQKIQLQSEKLEKPRTVCCNTRCIEIRDDGTGTNTKVTIYKTHCHAECWLDNVPLDTQAPPGLIWCTAFYGSNTCRKCSHHWSEHMHVIYELKEHLVTVEDNTIAQQLRQYSDDITLRQTAITKLNETIQEYEKEHDAIRFAAAKFGAFLKKNSITPINDATEAYLRFLIKGEQDKVDVGGNDLKLRALMEDLRRHKETVDVLTRSMSDNSNTYDLTEAGVERTTQELYRLKHFGKNLKSLQHGISLAHQATNRERPITVKRTANGNGRRQPRKLEIRNKPTPAAQQAPYNPFRPLVQSADRRPSHDGNGNVVSRIYGKAKSFLLL